MHNQAGASRSIAVCKQGRQDQQLCAYEALHCHHLLAGAKRHWLLLSLPLLRILFELRRPQTLLFNQTQTAPTDLVQLSPNGRARLVQRRNQRAAVL